LEINPSPRASGGENERVFDCDDSAAQAEESIKEIGLSWAQGLAGDVISGVAARYKVREFPNLVFTGPDRRDRRIPVTFLIGPDGRIVAHDLRGADLGAVRKALENPKLFPAAGAPADRPDSR
jgi:hypothetical protein